MKVLLFILVLCVTAMAQVTVSSTTGTLVHGESIVIGGTNFGSKSPAAPVLWDDCNDTTKLATYYAETLPSAANQGAVYNMDYRTEAFITGRSITMPNDYTSYALSGAHATSIHGYTTGNNVSLLVDVWNAGATDPQFYISYYYRVDPAFDEENSGGLGDNMKELCISGDATQIYGSGTWGYYDWCNSDVPDVNMTTNDIKVSRRGIDEPALPYGCSGNNLVENYNPINGWVRMEWLGDYDLGEDNPTAELRLFKDGTGQYRTYQDHYGSALTTYETMYGYGSPDNSNYRSLGIGGFARTNRENNGVNSYRYFANIYVDSVHSRVVIGNASTFAACTIIEPQPPTAWSTTSITVTANLGKLTTGTAYVYVFDASNNSNATGYTITLPGDSITVSSTSSATFTHGDTITISGYSFGSKSPAKPLMWDDCEDRTLDTLYVDSVNAYSRSVYSERQPGAIRNGDAIPLTHRTRYVALPYTPQGATGALTQITAPHSNSTRCISGGHYYEVGFDGNNGARDVQVTVSTEDGIGNFSSRWYAHWYYRVNSDFPTCGSLNNHKTSSIQSDIVAYGGSTYSNDFQYLNYANPLTPCITDSSGLNLRHQSDIGDCDDYTAAGRNNSFANTRYEWQIWEEFVSDHADDGMRVAMIDNDSVWVCLNKGAWFTSYAGQGIGSFTLGGYFRLNIDPPVGGEQSSDAHRLYDDIYIDDTFSRVMLGNSAVYTSCTVVEPQPPISWASTSIQVEINQGALPDGTAYLYVFDSLSAHNADGYSITLGAEAASPTLNKVLNVIKIK